MIIFLKKMIKIIIYALLLLNIQKEFVSAEKNILMDLNQEKSFQISNLLAYNPPVKKGPGEKIWKFTLAGWYNSFAGNTDSMVSNSSSTLEMDDDVSNFELAYTIFYDKVNDSVTNNKGNAIIKYDHFILPRLVLFIFSKSEYNKIAFLKHRNNSGGGTKLVMVKNDTILTDISGALTYQYENYETKSHTNDYRWSLRYKLKINILSKLMFNFVYYYIPEIGNIDTYRLIMDANASLKIEKYLSFKIGYNNSYNKNALPGTKKTDEILYSQLALEY